MYGARQASSVSMYADSDPVTAHAAAGQARPITPLNTAADADEHAFPHRERVTAPGDPAVDHVQARASAKARPLGRVSAITAITGKSSAYRRSSRRYSASVRKNRCIDSA